MKGIGTDIIEIDRFKKVMEKHPKRFLERIFSEAEVEYSSRYKDSTSHLAARFSAKEAISKALGTGFGKKLSFKDIQIKNNEDGKPEVVLSKKANSAFGNPKVELSISHCKKYATATAICY